MIITFSVATSLLFCIKVTKYIPLVKELRKQEYANYEHIAFELKMSRSAYWRIESGENFELKTLIKICKLLGITLEEFFEGVDLPKAVKKKSR